MQGTWENGSFVLASTKDERIDRLSKDAARFAFMEANCIKCGVRENGYWEATSEADTMPWVSRKTLAECIDVLMGANADVTGLAPEGDKS